MLYPLALATLLLHAVALAGRKPAPPDVAFPTIDDTSDGGQHNAFAHPNHTVQVMLRAGRQRIPVTGVNAHGVDAFLGIPYAAPRECQRVAGRFASANALQP